MIRRVLWRAACCIVVPYCFLRLLTYLIFGSFHPEVTWQVAALSLAVALFVGFAWGKSMNEHWKRKDAKDGTVQRSTRRSS